MKLLYLTIPSYFDLEISLIRELSKRVEIKVLMIVTPQSQHSSAFSISYLEDKEVIKSFSSIPEMLVYANLIDLNIWYIASTPVNSLLHNILLSKYIMNYVREWKPDVIHSTSIGKCALTLAPMIVGFKKILTLHDPIPHEKLNLLENLSRTIIMIVYHNLLFLSKEQAKLFHKHNPIKYYKVFFSKLSVYDFLTSFNSEMVLPPKYILFFGRIDYYKGVDLLVRAYKQSIAYNKGVKLVIAGKGKINLPAEELKDVNIYVINRYIVNSELAELIKNASFIVLPYRSATQSGCLMSAYAFNKPVVASAVGELRNEIINGTTGYLVPPNSQIALIEGINRMCEDNALKVMSQNISKKYSSTGENSWQSIAQNLLLVYNDL